MFGRQLGIAFQIADDLMDVVGTETAAGKSLGTDLEKQKPTLPLIRALQIASVAERQDMLAALQGEPGSSLDRLRVRFEQLDVLTYTRNKATAYAQQALDELVGLPDSPAVQSLRQMAAFVVQRAF
jgi:octaprenyl-diphosphate synthase